ncbi:Carboxypeptidase s [Pyrenophora tritici-repentis]|nr:Carboxypeptidase s [Pyrenophora tritici-repentis]
MTTSYARPKSIRSATLPPSTSTFKMASNTLEKQTKQLPEPPKHPYKRQFITSGLFCFAILGFLRHYIIAPTSSSRWSLSTGFNSVETKEQCSQVEPLFPARTTKGMEEMEAYLTSDAFRDVAIERLSGAVKIPTQSYDDMGTIGEDPRWDIFYSFADYLSKTYPLVHATLQLEKVNTHGLLYTWAGSDPSLKPNLLMAHQDVVPVPDSTIKQWSYPPFSGHYDGKFVWGRGASDCKNQLMAILNAVEALIAADFTPKRTLILSFGFDEEISGREGAQHLANYLLKKLGHNSIAAIVDEGAVNIETWGANFAIPGVAEKGYIDVDIVVRMPGGHSSIPPAHNGIGVASELITLIEANAYDPYLDDSNPYLGLLQCGASHASDFPRPLAKLLHNRSSHHKACSKKDALALEAAKAGPAVKYLFTTSVAVDIIHGGVKTNALPERTLMTVNHRINVGSSSDVVKTHITALAAQVAQKYDLTLHAFNGEEESPSRVRAHLDTVRWMWGWVRNVDEGVF